KQTAYRILVSSSPDILKEERGDLWDSGKIESDETLNVFYNGKELVSRTRYFWKARVWDKDDAASPWSQAAWFETAFLKNEDWKAKWITWDRGNAEGFDMKNASWIWSAAPSSQKNNARYFRKSVSLPQKPIKQILLGAAAEKEFIFYANGCEVARWDNGKKILLTDMTGLLKKGKNVLCVQAKGGKGFPLGFSGKMRIIFCDKSEMVITTDKTWKACDKIQKDWHKIDFQDAKWEKAKENGVYGCAPWGELNFSGLKSPAPLFRKEFTASHKIKQARLYISGLGYYVARIDGKKVGNNVLDPGNTNYNKRALYSIHDVTELVDEKKNCIAVELGRGFFGLKSPNVWNWEKAPWHGDPRMILQLEMEYIDGTREIIVSDESWKASPSPTISDSIYCGESYDARREKTGWDLPGYRDSDWANATPCPSPAPVVKAQTLPPIQKIEEITPKKITKTKAGSFAFDLGMVTSGWIRLRAKAKSGTFITIKYGERLNGDGTVNNANDIVYEPNQQDTYIFKGAGVETYEPRFSYKGFRYVEIIGLEKADKNILTGISVHSNVKGSGEFRCSNELFNQIYRITRRTILNNLHSIPTDTPVYEKNGWTGDAQLIAETAIFNFDMHAFYSKWITDLRDAQQDSGMIPLIVPFGIWGAENSPEWGYVHISLPWDLYWYYGDKKILEDHYTSMKKYADFQISRLNDYKASSCLSDWVAPQTVSDSPHGNVIPQAPEGNLITSTAYVFAALRIVARAAEIMGEKEVAEKYRAVMEKIKEALNRDCLDKEAGVYRTNIAVGYRQTSNILPLAFGIAPQELKNRVADNLAIHVRKKGDHLDTGILGTKYILPVLTENGFGNLAYNVANQRTYPSWGYWIEQGATTLWECWELASRSLDHYMFGTVVEWFYKYIAGIRPLSPGFQTIRIKPPLFGDLKNASATIHTVRGAVSVEWNKKPGGIFQMKILIPVNTTAEVYIPCKKGSKIQEGNIPTNKVDGIQFLRWKDGYALYAVGSGDYDFKSKI
ncbi:family 78 glycoside hydrolase catalytic domain, partial [Candidatus Sumerlaeota bacterium]|nr:family 78 glycoside hydrolase catalytic domain [Candidatus Sumerlaeota bacterium]